MNVGLVLNLFSKSVSSGLRYLQEQEGRCISYETTAWFVDSINKWFELMSSRHPVMALFNNQSQQYLSAKTHLDTVVKVMAGIQVGVKVAWKPVQTAMIMSTTAVFNLCDELLHSKLEFFLASRLTQDCVENLFSVVRSRHPAPTAREFKYALKLICTAQYLKPVKSSNYLLDDR